MNALAMCRQFHVRSISISWTVASAMCAASRSALAGSTPESRMLWVNASTSSVARATVMPLISANRCFGFFALCDFVEDDLRGEKFVLLALQIPPVARELL